MKDEKYSSSGGRDKKSEILKVMEWKVRNTEGQVARMEDRYT